MLDYDCVDKTRKVSHSDSDTSKSNKIRGRGTTTYGPKNEPHNKNVHSKISKGLNFSRQTLPPNVQGKLLIVGDSHGRGLSNKLQNKPSNMSVSGFTKPGATLEQVTETCLPFGRELSAKDVVLIIAGTNDVARNEAPQALRTLRKVLSNLQRTNVVICTIPQRYDLGNSSINNREVCSTNTKIYALSKHFKYVQVFDISYIPRRFHTKHGLYLHKTGKVFITNMICNIIKKNTLPYSSISFPCSSRF